MTMTIYKAKAILALDNVDDWRGSDSDRKAAQQLGIEAMEAVQRIRNIYPNCSYIELPGETKE